jgi:hypothetical protein
MTYDTPLAFDLPAVRRQKLTIDFDAGHGCSDFAGQLSLGIRWSIAAGFLRELLHAYFIDSLELIISAGFR